MDISNSLISEQDIRESLVAIFPDSIVIKGSNRIIAVGEDAAHALSYSATHLIGSEVSKILEPEEQFLELHEGLSKGFFNHLGLSLKGSSAAIPCEVSGFCLGLISDINGISILKIKPVEPVKILNEQLDASQKELDEFVYRTTHDLRGPLATMRGLINLMMMEMDQTSGLNPKELVSLLQRYAQILDDRLFNLNYLSQSANARDTDYNLDCSALESTLRSTLEQNLVMDNMDFQITSSQRFFKGVNASLSVAMLNHLLLYLISLPRSLHVRISISIQSTVSGMQVTINSEGFHSNEKLRRVIHDDSIYTTVISYSNLINFFAARKNAQRIKAQMAIDFTDDAKQKITVVVPQGVSVFE